MLRKRRFHPRILVVESPWRLAPCLDMPRTPTSDTTWQRCAMLDLVKSDFSEFGVTPLSSRLRRMALTLVSWSFEDSPKIEMSSIIWIPAKFSRIFFIILWKCSGLILNGNRWKHYLPKPREGVMKVIFPVMMAQGKLSGGGGIWPNLSTRHYAVRLIDGMM